jgi:hypothetical protein
LVIEENPLSSAGEVFDPGFLVFGDKKIPLKEN